MALPDPLRSLLSPEAYPHPVAAAHLVETHISWILLTGEFAYKIKRPIHLPFVDQRTAERRAFLCAEELRLNRRFAPDLYLEVCDITTDGSAIRMSGSGTVVEHAVKMRQFDRVVTASTHCSALSQLSLRHMLPTFMLAPSHCRLLWLRSREMWEPLRI
jgi:aminoglycoside phosphotransferase family enzyme